MNQFQAQDLIAEQAYSQEIFEDKIPVKPEESKYSVTDSEVSDEMYAVEKIVDKRNNMGKLEYLVKWKDYSSDENQWKPVEELTFVENLIEEYEKSKKKQKVPQVKKTILRKRTAPIKVETIEKKVEKPKLSHFAKISAAQLYHGQIYFKVDSNEVISSAEARFINPQAVIDFYERKISW